MNVIKGKTMWVTAASLALAAFGIGLWSEWSLLGLMNRVDGVLAPSGPRALVRGEAYGSEPRQRLNIWAADEPTKDRSARDVIVFFYGGSWNSGGRDFYDFVGRALAEHGYVVVIPDYRLVPQVRFPAFVEDGAAALAWTSANISRFGGNPQRIFVAGHSAGAHIGAMVTLDAQWLAKAGATADTIKGFVGLAGPYDFYPFTSDAARNAFGGMADPMQGQPIHFARKDAPPMLLLHGSMDTTVKPRNSRALAEAQIRLGAAADVKIYEGATHNDPVMALSTPFRGRAPVIADIIAFTQAH